MNYINTGWGISGKAAALKKRPKLTRQIQVELIVLRQKKSLKDLRKVGNTHLKESTENEQKPRVFLVVKLVLH